MNIHKQLDALDQYPCASCFILTETGAASSVWENGASTFTNRKKGGTLLYFQLDKKDQAIKQNLCHLAACSKNPSSDGLIWVRIWIYITTRIGMPKIKRDFILEGVSCEQFSYTVHLLLLSVFCENICFVLCTVLPVGVDTVLTLHKYP